MGISRRVASPDQPGQSNSGCGELGPLYAARDLLGR